MKDRPIIHSDYNSKEKFSFEEAPSEFKSITQKSINEIKTYCTRTIAIKYKGTYSPNALYPMVGTIVGNFDLLSSRLKEDYSNRRAKLKKAQSLGSAKVEKLIIEFDKTVSDYEMAYRRFYENIKEYEDAPVRDERVHSSKERLLEFEKRLKKIEEKNHEA